MEDEASPVVEQQEWGKIREISERPSQRLNTQLTRVPKRGNRHGRRGIYELKRTTEIGFNEKEIGGAFQIKKPSSDKGSILTTVKFQGTEGFKTNVMKAE